MNRVLKIAVAAGLVLAACGGGDDATDEAVAAVDEPAADDPSPNTADEGVDEGVDEAAEGAATTVAAGEPAGDDEPSVVAESLMVNSLADVPEICKEQMAGFLEAIEPLVSSIDWRNASLRDFEEIAEQFDSLSDDFDALEAESGCDDLDMGGNEFEILVEFADQVAPGTVAFFTWLESFGAFDDDEGGADDAMPLPGEGFENCAEAIEWVEGLMADHGSFMEVPATEIMRFAGLGEIYTTCSPEQLQFFGSEEVAAFLDADG